MKPNRSRAEPNDIQVGWLLVGRLDAVDREAVLEARERLLARFSRELPAFEWRMPLVERVDLAQGIREEPLDLLGFGITERDSRGWDYALVVTGADLVAYESPFALGVPSRALTVATLSTSRIDPRATGQRVSDSERGTLLTGRVEALALHLLGHLAGLPHEDEPDSVMFDLGGESDLDAMTRLSEHARELLENELRGVADLRLEEVEHRPNRLAFYIRATWNNLSATAGAIWRIRPWTFPLQLPRLTTAAVSAVLLLVHAAETWELGMAQRWTTVAGMAVIIWVATTWFVVRRQSLLPKRERTPLTEQTVLSHVSVVAGVGLGMVVTYVTLFAMAFALAVALFPGWLVAQWASISATEVNVGLRALFAAFLASVGLAVGALGASFEKQQYFRHIAYVDEET